MDSGDNVYTDNNTDADDYADMGGHLDAAAGRSMADVPPL